MEKEPLVSVCMITYNHEKYISEAIDSVLKQSVNFTVEFVISNDSSTDETHNAIYSVINRNKNKYLKIRYYNQPNNLGMMPNFIWALQQCKGKYIALCDGDDYWIDPLKLKKQVEFLEGNTDVSLCFTKAKKLKNFILSDFELPKGMPEKISFSLLLTFGNFIASASIMFRSLKINEFPAFIKKSPFGDLALYKLLSSQGKLACINETTTVYRIHDNGIWSGNTVKINYKKYLNFYRLIFNVLNKQEQKIVRQKVKEKIYKLIRLKFPSNTILRGIGKLYYRILFFRIWL